MIRHEPVALLLVECERVKLKSEKTIERKAFPLSTSEVSERWNASVWVYVEVHKHQKQSLRDKKRKLRVSLINASLFCSVQL